MTYWDDRSWWEMLTNVDGETSAYRLIESGFEMVVPNPPRPEAQADGAGE